MKKLFLLILVCFIFTSCDFLPIITEVIIAIASQNQEAPNTEASNSSNTEETIPSSKEDVPAKALEYAYKYCHADTKYQLGGQDKLRTIKVDCSGLVINCYLYAIEGTKFTLPFSDTTSALLYSTYTTRVESPRPGDLIFMGPENSKKIDHVGIFVKKEGNKIWFIDATESYNVKERYYESTNKKIKGFGIMRLENK